MGWEQDSWVIARAADLLEQRHPTPVPVAEPEPEAGPTDEELDSMERQHWEETGVEEWGRQEAIFDHRAFARAVLARWGHQLAPLAEVGCPACEGVPKPGNQPCAVCGRPAPAPAEGEVAELVEFLRIYGDEVMDEYGDVGEHDQLTRAAELLEQRHPTPVPVAERLPGPKDCDAEGRCWVHQPHEACPESPAWELMLAKYASANYEAVCWLPANALPLPSGEVE
jgi:hypothetical protein